MVVRASIGGAGGTDSARIWSILSRLKSMPSSHPGRLTPPTGQPLLRASLQQLGLGTHVYQQHQHHQHERHQYHQQQQQVASRVCEGPAA